MSDEAFVDYEPVARRLAQGLSRAAVAVGAGTSKDSFALRFKLVERRIRVGQRNGTRANGVCKSANASVGKEYALERGEVIQHALRWRRPDLRMISERSECLFLKIGKSCIELVPARLVRAAR